MKKIIFILALLPVILYGQQDRVIRDTGGSGANIYNTSDTLTSDRLVDLNGYSLEIKTDSNTSADQYGLRLSPGHYGEFVNHWPLIISAGPAGAAMDTIAFGTFDSNLAIYTNTGGMRYGGAYMFIHPQAIIDKAYCDANVAGATGTGKGGIYEGDGNLPENVRASGGPSEYKMEFDSIGVFEIKDWNEGQALRIVQDFSGVTKFGRGITYVGANDSLDVNYTEAGANSVFTIDATKPINIDAKNTIINPDSVSMNFGNATFTDNRGSLGGATHGIKYAADYSASFVSRSLVDKAYCDSNGGSSLARGSLYRSTGLTLNSYANYTSVTGLNSEYLQSFTAVDSALTFTGTNGTPVKIRYTGTVRLAPTTAGNYLQKFRIYISGSGEGDSEAEARIQAPASGTWAIPIAGETWVTLNNGMIISLKASGTSGLSAVLQNVKISVEEL